MKTLEEAKACVMRPTEDPDAPATDSDVVSGESLSSLGRDIHDNLMCQIYVDASAQYCMVHSEDLESLIRMFGMAMLTAGVRIGIEMEKP